MCSTSISHTCVHVHEQTNSNGLLFPPTISVLHGFVGLTKSKQNGYVFIKFCPSNILYMIHTFKMFKGSNLRSEMICTRQLLKRYLCF